MDYRASLSNYVEQLETAYQQAYAEFQSQPAHPDPLRMRDMYGHPILGDMLVGIVNGYAALVMSEP